MALCKLPASNASMRQLAVRAKLELVLRLCCAAMAVFDTPTLTTLMLATDELRGQVGDHLPARWQGPSRGGGGGVGGAHRGAHVCASRDLQFWVTHQPLALV